MASFTIDLLNPSLVSEINKNLAHELRQKMVAANLVKNEGSFLPFGILLKGLEVHPEETLPLIGSEEDAAEAEFTNISRFSQPGPKMLLS